MPIRVEPIYGWGWFDREGSMDVPGPFDLEPILTGDGVWPSGLLGQVSLVAHPLDGFWVVLVRRNPDGPQAGYNLYAYGQRPQGDEFDVLVAQAADFTGFAQLGSQA